MINDKPLLNSFKNKNVNYTPIWLMRQAGRYLSEYRKIREQSGSFLDLCYNPELAAEVSLQPIRRFGFDGAIIFSDILVIPDSMGMEVSFLSGEGPKLNKIMDQSQIDKLTTSNHEKLDKVYQSIKITKNNLPVKTTMIGFAGAPWTIATYMVEGGSSKDFSLSKKMAYNNPEIFGQIIEKLVTAISNHLINQIEAGVEVVQIFDSWSSVLNKENFIKWVIEPTKQIVDNVKKLYPDVPIIGFPKGAGFFYHNDISEIKIDGISLDSNLPYEYIDHNLKGKLTLQGNLDPVYLLGNKNTLKEQVLKTLDNFSSNKYIFNLGHGIIKETPVENVEFLIETIRNYR